MSSIIGSALSTMVVLPMTVGFRLLLNPDNPAFETMSTIASYVALHKIATMQSEMAQEAVCNHCEDFWQVIQDPENNLQTKLLSAKNYFIQSIFCGKTPIDKTGSIIKISFVLVPVFDMLGKTFLGIRPPNHIHPIIRIGFAAMLTGTQFTLTRPSIWD